MLLSEALLVATCVLAAVVDHRRGEIPDSLSLGACGAAAFAGAAASLSASADGALLGALAPSLLRTAGGALLTALVPLLLWRRGALGGGDVKLFAAVGAFLGPLRGLEACLASFLVGSLLGLVALARAGALGATLEHVAGSATRPFGRGAAEVPAAPQTWMRFAPAILLGTLAVLFLRGGAR